MDVPSAALRVCSFRLLTIKAKSAKLAPCCIEKRDFGLLGKQNLSGH